MSSATDRPADTRDLARAIRCHALRMVHDAGASHIGTCLSMADLLAVLYGAILRVRPGDPDWPERDRFVLSKGHGAAALYAALAEAGFFPVDRLKTFCCDSSPLAGHVSHRVPGVELSTGSLGHGLPVGAGLALGAKADGRPSRTFVLLGDGEMDEGSNWEASLVASHHGLDNLVAIVDRNGIQAFGATEETLRLEPLAEKLTAFGWVVREVDGHDHAALASTLSALPFTAGRPSAVIAHTTKGKGVSYMEDRLEWHYRSPDSEQLDRALREIGEA